jgi:hypothetical protein
MKNFNNENSGKIMLKCPLGAQIALYIHKNSQKQLIFSKEMCPK